MVIETMKAAKREIEVLKNHLTRVLTDGGIDNLPAFPLGPHPGIDI